MIGVAHICGHDCSASANPFAAMHKNCASAGDGLMNELARGREVDKEVCVVDVIDWDPQLFKSASRQISWDGVRANGHYVSDLPLGYGPRSASGDQTVREIGRTRQVNGRIEWNG